MFLDKQNFESKKENELAEKILKNTNQADNYDLAQLYPEFDLTGTYATLSPSLGLARSLVAFDRVIVKIAPLRTEQDFIACYGTSLEQMKRLIQMNKVLPLICFPYSDYPCFFSSLFNLGHFPRTNRVRALLHLDTQCDRNSIRIEVEKLLKNRKWSSWVFEKFGDYHGNPKDLMLETYTSDLYDFNLLGMNELTELFLELAVYDPKMAHRLCSDYSDYLVKPLFETLDGINSFGADDLNLARQLFLSADIIKNKYFKKTPKLINGIESFLGVNPTELTRFLEHSVPISLPENISHYEMFCNYLEKEEDIQYFRKSLKSLSITKLNGNAFEQLRDTSKRVSQFIERDIRRLDAVAKRVSWSLRFGATLTPLAMANSMDLGANSLFSTFASAAIAQSVSDDKQRFDELSRKLLNSTYQKLASKPLVTTLWNGRSED